MRGMIGPALVLAACSLYAQAALQPPAGERPTLDDVRASMAVASHGDERGQLDGVGYASTPEQMARVWELAAGPPEPERFEAWPAPGVAGVVAPHDDYVYAARVQKRVASLVRARTVVVVGVFHDYRRFGVRDRLVFDSYRSWRTPDGPVPVSPLRDEVLAALDAGDFVRDDAAHDSEHSIEALLYWLRHARPDLEIVPVLAPAARFERVDALATRLGDALAAAARRHGLALGRDLAIVVSSDAVHYGADFQYEPYGAGGVDAYVKAVARDRELLAGPLTGPLSRDAARALFAAFVDPADPDTYRMTWCGRFSVPFGMRLVEQTARALGQPAPLARPVAYATSVGQPELPVKAVGLGATAPANLYHFVGQPGVAFVLP